jgi:hypothetical protein
VQTEQAKIGLILAVEYDDDDDDDDDGDIKLILLVNI